LIEGALWPANEDLAIENPSSTSYAFRVVEAPSPQSSYIKGFTVADILARSDKQRIDQLKLDIEGAEERLFSSNYSNWIPHVKTMMIEPHSQQSLDIMSSVAKDCGFLITQSGEYIVFAKE
jgi:hypothetical protein